MIKIEKIFAEEIMDSRDKLTLKAGVVVAGGAVGYFSVPSGASTGAHEALAIDVPRAVDNVNNVIAPAILGMNVLNQVAIDEAMIKLDGTPNKGRLGANALIGVSIAVAKAAASASSLPVFEYLRTLRDVRPTQAAPYLFMNLLNGGKHANNGLAFQEYHVVPETNDVSCALEIGEKVQDVLEKILRSEFGEGSLVMGDEGGFAPRVESVRQPLELLKRAITGANVELPVRLALDVAASSFYTGDGLYDVDGKKVPRGELMELHRSLAEDFNLLSIEDPLEEEDFGGFRELRGTLHDVAIVGDDLTVTNPSLLKRAIEEKSIDAMIVKPNQIGTLSETLETMSLAREMDIKLIVSHRSGETDDDFIADLAYAFGCFGLKAGAPRKPERRVKYERLKFISR